MKINDLIVLLFPGSEHDEEVLKGGRALFNKHVSKHLLGLKQAHGNTDDLLAKLSEKSQPSNATAAQRAWLIEVMPKVDLSGPLELAVSYKLLASTHAFSPGTLDKTSTGIYVVSHCDYGLLNIFGHYGRHPEITGGQPGAFESHVDQAATKLATFIKKLGVESIQKLCLVACNTVPREGGQKDMLESLMWKLHEQNLHPKVAGWDIPVVMVTAEGENYGKKQNQSTHEPAAKLRTNNKFVYTYHELADKFTMKTDKADKQTEVDAQLTREFKKVPAKQEIRGDPKPQITTKTPSADGKKTELAWRVNVVRKMKYSLKNWSAE